MTFKTLSNDILNLIKASIHKPQEENLEKNSIHLNNGYDAIACLINAYMLSLGFKLLGLGETHSIDTPITSSNIKSLSKVWHQSKDSFYAFRYVFKNNNDVYLIKLLKMDKKIAILGTTMGNEDTLLCDLYIDHYVQKDLFPYTNESENTPLIDLYVSNAKILDLVEKYKISILQKLIPEPKYNNTTEEIFINSAFIPASIPEELETESIKEHLPCGFNRHIKNIHVTYPSPFSIGSDDLYPSGIGPRPSLGPYISDDIISESISPCGNNGMYPDRNHPIFTHDRVIAHERILPPGARYDPISPDDKFGIGPGYLNKPPLKYKNIGEPDNDEFLPPGVDSMYM